MVGLNFFWIRITSFSDVSCMCFFPYALLVWLEVCVMYGPQVTGERRKLASVVSCSSFRISWATSTWQWLMELVGSPLFFSLSPFFPLVRFPQSSPVYFVHLISLCVSHEVLSWRFVLYPPCQCCRVSSDFLSQGSAILGSNHIAPELTQVSMGEHTKQSIPKISKKQVGAECFLSSQCYLI